jgi:hypothetical protein
MAFEMVELIRTASGRRSYSSVHTKMWTRFCGAFASGFILWVTAKPATCRILYQKMLSIFWERGRERERS